MTIYCCCICLLLDFEYIAVVHFAIFRFLEDFGLFSFSLLNISSVNSYLLNLLCCNLSIFTFIFIFINS